MKKAFLLSLFLLASTVCSFAQLKEVRGVETKRTAYNKTGDKTDYFGFTFTNKNKYPVSIDVELWYQGHPYFYWTGDNPKEDPRIVQTKAFILEAGEEYLWKTDLANGSGPVAHYWSPDKYYVKYKAYKDE